MTQGRCFLLGLCAAALGVPLACGSFSGADTSTGAPDDGGGGDHRESPTEDGGGITGGDAGFIGDAGARPCDLGSAWSAPTQVLFDTSLYTAFATLSEDELVIYYDKLLSLPSRATIFVSKRANRSPDTFAAGSELANVPSVTNDTYMAALSPDQTTMVVTSNRGLLGGYGLFESVRADAAAPFGGVSELAVLNSSATDHEAFLSPTEIWFASNRNGDQDIFHASIGAGGFSAPSPATELSSSATESKPVVTRDGRTIFFGSDRADSGATAVWTSARASTASAFGAPTRIAELDSPQDDYPTWISPDGCRLYMTSGRSGAAAIYVTSHAP